MREEAKLKKKAARKNMKTSIHAVNSVVKFKNKLAAEKARKAAEKEKKQAIQRSKPFCTQIKDYVIGKLTATTADDVKENMDNFLAYLMVSVNRCSLSAQDESGLGYCFCCCLQLNLTVVLHFNTAFFFLQCSLFYLFFRYSFVSCSS